MKRILVMGVAGSGKSTLSAALADRLALPLVEADDFHDDAARAAMSRGEGLDDARRAPWLDRVADAARNAGPCVIACSALKAVYRARLAPDATICLLADQVTIMRRLAERAASPSGHFAGPELAASQFADFEVPQAGPDVLLIDATLETDKLVTTAIRWLM